MMRKKQDMCWRGGRGYFPPPLVNRFENKRKNCNDSLTKWGISNVAMATPCGVLPQPHNAVQTIHQLEEP